MSHHGFCCLDHSTNHVFISWHAIFYELNYPFKGTPCSRPFPNSLVNVFLEPTTILMVELPNQLNPISHLCGSYLTDPSASFVPHSDL